MKRDMCNEKTCKVSCTQSGTGNENISMFLAAAVCMFVRVCVSYDSDIFIPPLLILVESLTLILNSGFFLL